MKRGFCIFFLGFFVLFSGNILAPVLGDTYNLDVTATVPANGPTNAELQISTAPASSTQLKANDIVTITLHYRSQESRAWPFEVVGSWDPGQIEGNPSNTIDIFNYVVGSATPADDGTVPVIDSVNRKITWTIPSLSSSAFYHTVTFKLQVRSDIPTEKNITAEVHADGKISNTPLPQQTFTFNVKKSLPVSPITPSLAPIGPGLGFISVGIEDITNTSAQISFKTTGKTSYNIFYGTSPKSLNAQIASPIFEVSHTITLSELQPDTSYFFKILAHDKTGATITSDIFTFRTASAADTLEINPKDIEITSQNFLLTSTIINRIVLPKKTPLTINLFIKNPHAIGHIKARFQNTLVLGISTFTSVANIGETPLIETLPGVFTGGIQSPSTSGKYQLTFEIENIYGGRSTRIAPYEIYVSAPLRVIDKKTQKPVENATIHISKFDNNRGIYIPLVNSFSLPHLTDEKGELNLALPSGKYNIQVGALLYKPFSQTVELGISTTSYPSISLGPDLSLAGIISHIKQSVINVCVSFRDSASRLLASSQLEEFIYVITGSVSLLLIICILWERETIKHLRSVRRTFLSYVISLTFLSVINALLTLSFVFSVILVYNLKLVGPLIASTVALLLFANVLKLYWLSSRPPRK